MEAKNLSIAGIIFAFGFMANSECSLRGLSRLANSAGSLIGRGSSVSSTQSTTPREVDVISDVSSNKIEIRTIKDDGLDNESKRIRNQDRITMKHRQDEGNKFTIKLEAREQGKVFKKNALRFINYSEKAGATTLEAEEFGAMIANLVSRYCYSVNPLMSNVPQVSAVLIGRLLETSKSKEYVKLIIEGMLEKYQREDGLIGQMAKKLCRLLQGKRFRQYFEVTAEKGEAVTEYNVKVLKLAERESKAQDQAMTAVKSTRSTSPTQPEWEPDEAMWIDTDMLEEGTASVPATSRSPSTMSMSR